MNELLRALEVFDKTYEPIREIGDLMVFTAFIGSTIDQWVADHDLPWEAGGHILNAILDTRDDVREECGEATKVR